MDGWHVPESGTPGEETRMEEEKKENERQKRVQTNLRLPERMKEEILRETEKLGISMNDYMLLAIRDYIRNQT